MESMTDTTPGIGKRCLSAFIGALMILSLGSLFVAPGQALAASSASPIVPGDTSSTDAVQQITVNADVNGNGSLTDPQDISETFTYDELKDMGLIDTTNVKGYLYKVNTDNGYRWYVAAAKNYVTMDDLLSAADQAVGGGQAVRNALSVWNFGSLSEMTFDVMNPNKNADPNDPDTDYICEPYTKCTFTKSSLTGQDQFFNNLSGTGAFMQGNKTGVDVPNVLAFDYATQLISDDGRADTTLTNIKTSATFENNTRFFMGISLANVETSDSGDMNMGRRFPYSVTQINIYPAGAPDTVAAE